MLSINVHEYHSEPLVTLTLPDGRVWRVEKPREVHRFASEDVIRERGARWEAYLAEKRAQHEHELEQAGKSARRDELAGLVAAQDAREDTSEDADLEELRAELEELQPPEPTEEEDTIPLNLTIRWLNAAVVACYIDKRPTPEHVLDLLGEALIMELQAVLGAELDGSAGKSRMAAKLN